MSNRSDNVPARVSCDTVARSLTCGLMRQSPPNFACPNAAAAFVFRIARGQVQLDAAVGVAEDRDDRFAEHLPDVERALERTLAVRIARDEDAAIAHESRQAANRDLIRGIEEAAEHAEVLQPARIAGIAERVLVDLLVAVADAAADRDRALRPVLADVRLQGELEDVLRELLVVVDAARNVVDDLRR